MKKIFSVLLILVMCLSFVTLTACNSKVDNKTTTENSSETSSVNTNEGTSDEVSSENITDTNNAASPEEETAPVFSHDVIDLEADAYAVWEHASANLMPEGDDYFFEILNNIPGEDGKSCIIEYAVEDDSIINYYRAHLELDADGNWLVKENEFTHNQEK